MEVSAEDDLVPWVQVYISTMESKKYPYTATQWHPEKNAYEWGDKLHIPHSKGAIDVTFAGVLPTHRTSLMTAAVFMGQCSVACHVLMLVSLA